MFYELTHLFTSYLSLLLNCSVFLFSQPSTIRDREPYPGIKSIKQLNPSPLELSPECTYDTECTVKKGDGGDVSEKNVRTAISRSAVTESAGVSHGGIDIDIDKEGETCGGRDVFLTGMSMNMGNRDGQTDTAHRSASTAVRRSSFLLMPDTARDRTSEPWNVLTDKNRSFSRTLSTGRLYALVDNAVDKVENKVVCSAPRRLIMSNGILDLMLRNRLKEARVTRRDLGSTSSDRNGDRKSLDADDILRDACAATIQKYARRHFVRRVVGLMRHEGEYRSD